MNNLRVSLFTLFAVSFFLFSGCSDPCDEVTCLNDGFCIEGNCNCASGYEGDDCGTELNDKFEGTYTLSSSACQSQTIGTHTLTLGGSQTDPARVSVVGLHDNLTVSTINGSITDFNPDQLIISEQIITAFNSGDVYTVSGTGFLSEDGNTLQLNYSIFNVVNNSLFADCQDVFTR